MSGTAGGRRVDYWYDRTGLTWEDRAETDHKFLRDPGGRPLTIQSVSNTT